MATILWMHDGALRANHPMFECQPIQSADHVKTVFIWDNDYFAAAEMGLKQLVFIYEALIDLPVEIIEGSTVDVLRQLAGEDGTIVTASSSDLGLTQIMAALNTSHRLYQVADESFARLDKTPDLRRFFRYWNKAKSSAMQHYGGLPDFWIGS